MNNREYFDGEKRANRDHWKNADAVADARAKAKVDVKTKAAIEGIYNGTLAYSIKKHAKYTMVGVAVGVIGGVLAASFFKKSKLLFALGGGVVGAGAGILLTPKNDKK